MGRTASCRMQKKLKRIPKDAASREKNLEAVVMSGRMVSRLQRRCLKGKTERDSF